MHARASAEPAPQGQHHSAAPPTEFFAHQPSLSTSHSTCPSHTCLACMSFFLSPALCTQDGLCRRLCLRAATGRAPSSDRLINVHARCHSRFDHETRKQERAGTHKHDSSSNRSRAATRNAATDVLVRRDLRLGATPKTYSTFTIDLCNDQEEQLRRTTRATPPAAPPLEKRAQGASAGGSRGAQAADPAQVARTALPLPPARDAPRGRLAGPDSERPHGCARVGRDGVRHPGPAHAPDARAPESQAAGRARTRHDRRAQRSRIVRIPGAVARVGRKVMASSSLLRTTEAEEREVSAILLGAA